MKITNLVENWVGNVKNQHEGLLQKAKEFFLRREREKQIDEREDNSQGEQEMDIRAKNLWVFLRE